MKIELTKQEVKIVLDGLLGELMPERGINEKKVRCEKGTTTEERAERQARLNKQIADDKASTEKHNKKLDCLIEKIKAQTKS